MEKVSTSRTLIAGDIHFPFQDDKAVAKMLDFAKYFKPHRMILNGDIPDHYSISRFDKDITRKNDLQAEVDATIPFFDDLRRAVGRNCDIEWLEGNHEIRLRNFLPAAIKTLRSVQMESLYETERFGIKYVRANARGASVKVGKISVGHFDIVRRHSADTAQALVTTQFGSVIQGHTHRLGKYYHTAGGDEYVGVESGCLCSTKPSYLDSVDWQQGLVVIHKVVDKSRFFIVDVPIVGGDILYDGRLF